MSTLQPTEDQITRYSDKHQPLFFFSKHQLLPVSNDKYRGDYLIFLRLLECINNTMKFSLLILTKDS